MIENESGDAVLDLRHTDPDDSVIKSALSLAGRMDTGNSIIELNILSGDLIYMIAEISGEKKVFVHHGNGVVFPPLTTSEIAAINSSSIPGTVVYNSTTNKLQVRNASTFVDLH